MRGHSEAKAPTSGSQGVPHPTPPHPPALELRRDVLAGCLEREAAESGLGSALARGKDATSTRLRAQECKQLSAMANSWRPCWTEAE